MDAAFEQLMDQEAEGATPSGAEAAVMRAVRDEVLRRSAGARHRRGPDPVQPTREPVAEAPLPDDLAAPLAAFLARLPDTDEPVSVPTDLAAAILAVLPPRPSPTSLPSRTAAARDRSLAALGRASFLRGELASNNLGTIEPLVRAAMAQAGLPVADALDPALLEAGINGAIEGLHAEAARFLGKAPQPATLARPQLSSAAPRPAPAPRGLPVAPLSQAVQRPAPGECAVLSPDTSLSVAFEAFRRAKQVDRAWKASAERDAETTIRLFTEFFGDVPLRGITRDLVREFRGNLLDICSDWGQAAEYAHPADPKGNRRVDAKEVLRISRSRPKTVKRLATKTINKNTSALSGLWKWAQTDAGCEGLPHPTQGMQKKQKGAARRQAAKEAREAFRVSEIQGMFGSAKWRSWCPFGDGARSLLRQGGQGSRFFGVLFAAYMGMREREIVQLRQGDIEELDDSLVLIHIRPLADADYASELGIQRHRRAKDENVLKTLAADRVVPVHPVVLSLGFLQYLRLRGGSKSDFLFDDVVTPDNGARNLSRSFLELRRVAGIIRPGLDFHSLRHSARTMLNGLRVSRDDLDIIFGHENASDRDHVREVYQKGNWHRPLFDALAKLTYGVESFAEDTKALEQMRRDGFVLCR